MDQGLLWGRMKGCLKVSRCPVKCVKDVFWYQHFSIYTYILRCCHPYMIWTAIETKGIRRYVLWDIADHHNATIMHCSCLSLGICVWDTRHTVNTTFCNLAHQLRLSSPLTQVDSALLVTSPECLTHGYLSNCWYVPLWRESGQWVVKSAPGMTFFTMTW